MNGLTYTLRLIEPVLLKNLEGDANSARSLPYIPGSVIRGAIISAYFENNRFSETDAGEPEFRRLFLDGTTRYLHAFPDGDGERTLPTPLSWKIRKDDADGDETDPANWCKKIVKTVNVFDFSQEEADEDDLKTFKSATYWKGDETVYTAETPFQLNVHNQRDAVIGRSTEDQGGIFRYEALAAGLVFRGIILAEKNDELANLLKDRKIMLGKARTAGYGLAQIVDVEPLLPDWRYGLYWNESEDRDNYDDYEDYEDYEDEEYSDASHQEKEIFKFVVHFISAGLVRDSRGQFTPDPKLAIEANLNCSLETKKIFRASEIVGGFNRKWGLQLPQVMAISPGSVFVYKSKTPLSRKLLNKLEETGVGERRAEGFGNLIVHTYLPKKFEWSKSKSDELLPDIVNIKLNDVENELAERMLKRLLRKDLDTILMKTVQNSVIDGQIPNSQISRWRTILRSEIGKKATEITTDCIETFYVEFKKSDSCESFHRARVGKKRLTQWIEDILYGEKSPWNQMGKPETRSWGLEKSPEVTADDLAAEYKLRLIDAVLAYHSKRNRGIS